MAQSPADPDRQPPRFPCVAALLSAASLGAAVWTWMRYSYVWDVTPEYLSAILPVISEGRWPNRSYVRFQGEIAEEYETPTVSVAGGFTLHDDGRREYQVRPRGRRSGGRQLYVLTAFGTILPTGQLRTFTGRVSTVSFGGPLPDGQWASYAWLDSTASRFHGASIAGLAVGAMGVFVFTLAFRDWLNRRSALSVDQAEGET